MDDRLTRLYEIADGYGILHPGTHDDPYRIMSRIAEELGEVAAEVHHLERHAAKVHKLGVLGADRSGATEEK